MKETIRGKKILLSGRNVVALKSGSRPVWSTSLWLGPLMFPRAKNFSDFLAFHVRLQFVVLSAFFVLSPIIIQMNAALRSNSEFVTNATWVDVVAALGLFFYAFIMLYFILAVGCVYIWGRLATFLPNMRIVRVPIAISFCALFVVLELILTWIHDVNPW
jgi:hypothetical protein